MPKRGYRLCEAPWVFEFVFFLSFLLDLCQILARMSLKFQANDTSEENVTNHSQQALWWYHPIVWLLWNGAEYFSAFLFFFASFWIDLLRLWKRVNWRKMLTKSIRRQVVAVQGIQDMQQKPSPEKYLHSLVAHKRIKERVEEPFPDQLPFHNLEIN